MRRGPAATAIALGLALIVGVGPPGGRARAADAPAQRRSVAVIEYRAGVQLAAGVGDRLAQALRKAAALTVVDHPEAQRRLGPRIDSDVARCAGEAACVAAIGARLEVDEVLLVGVSQLGDVVLSLQRIDVDRAEVGARLAETLEADQELDDARLLAWLKKLYPPEVFRRYGFIAVTSNVDGATVTINGQDRGRTPLPGAGRIRVFAPRSYRVNLSKRGFLPFDARIDVLPDATVSVRAELVPTEGQVAWYKRWYLWAIVGGIAAAGAIGVTVYATRPDDQHVSGFVFR